MAIVTGPLYSQEVRGQFGKSIVFRRRKGQNVASAYTIPANPNSTSQVTVRDYLALAASVIRRTNAANTRLTSETGSIITFLTGLTVGPEVWPNVLSNYILGSSNATIAATVTEYSDLASNDQTTWQNDATATPWNMADITRSSGTMFTAGFQLFALQKALRTNGYGATWNSSNPTPEDTGS